MTDFKLPGSMTEMQKQCLKAAYSFQSMNGTFSTPDVYNKLFNNPDADIRYKISNFFSAWKMKGYTNKLEDGQWKLTEQGIYVVSNIDEISVRKEMDGPKYKKVALKDIKPIERPFKPNLSGSAATLAGTVGAVLDDNQAYRDFLKSQLISIAEFLNATVTFEDDQNGNS